MGKITDDQYHEAKSIVEQYESEHNINNMWKCEKDLFMEYNNRKVFTKGGLYRGIDKDLVLNEDGEEHYFGEWAKYFKRI